MRDDGHAAEHAAAGDEGHRDGRSGVELAQQREVLLVRGRGHEVVVADVDHQLGLTGADRPPDAPDAVAAGVVATAARLAHLVDQRRVPVHHGDLLQLARLVEHVDHAPVAEAGHDERRHPLHDRLRVERGDEDRAGLGQHGQALAGRLGLDPPLVLALEQATAHVLDELPLGDVGGDADHLHRLVAGVEHRAATDLEPALLAVPAHDPDLVLEVRRPPARRRRPSRGSPGGRRGG